MGTLLLSDTARAMAQEDAESFMGFIDAFNRRDADAMIEVVDSAVEWRPAAPVALGGEATVYRGRTGVADGLRDLHASFAELQIEITEVQEVGDRVVGTGRIRTRGKGSGAELETPFGAVMEFKDGKATQVCSYLDPNEALERAMSEENVPHDRQSRDLQVLQELYSHWERGDFTYWEAFADDYVWKAVDAVESGEYSGIAEVSAAWRTWLQAWDGFSIEAEEVLAGSDGRYVVMQLFRGKGKASGLESEERSAAVATLQDGLIVRMEGFWDRDAALRAAGVDRR